MIIYIHGFGGSGEGAKDKVFREYFKIIEESFIAPSLSYVPELANNLFKSTKLIESSADAIENAWDICKVPTLKWLEKNGSNRNLKN